MPNATKPRKPPPETAQHRHVLQTLAALYGWRTFVEVGVWKGDTSNYLLKHCTGLEQVVSVDPWVLPVGKMSEPGFWDCNGTDMDALYRSVRALLRPYGTRSTVVRTTSVEAAKQFLDGSLDAVFIDGDHRFEHVVADISAWLPKVRGGGQLLGHDVDMPPVRQAVENYFSSHWTELPDRVWIRQC